MLRRAAVVATAAAGIAAAAGCGGGSSDDPGDALAERVVALLEADGDAVDGDLDGAEVACPDVREPDPGDTATCDVRFGGATEVQVDVEFQDGGAITVTAVVPVSTGAGG